MAIAYSPKVVTDSLQMYVDAANIKSYPGTGSVWYNLAGSGGNFTLYNSPVLSNKTLQFRQATLNNSLGTVDAGILKNATETGQWSLEVMFKYVAVSSDESVIIGRAGCHGGIYLNNNGVAVAAIKTTNANCWTGAVLIGSGSLTIGNTYHMVMTYNNGVTNFYVNGAFVGTQTFDKTTYDIFGYNNTMYVGGISPQYFPNIDIHIARAYSKELSATEVLENFNTCRGRASI